jgi:RNA polymerase sigma-70 factor (ECF subfamily)
MTSALRTSPQGPLAQRPLAGGDPHIALMLRVQRDEPGAFAELVREFQTRVFARLLRSLPDRHQAEDLTQEVFLRLFRSRKRYEPRARFATWIFHIAQNVARNAVRTRQRHAWLHYVASDKVEFARSEKCGGPDQSARLERLEAARQVRAGLDGLLDRQRRALELQHFHDRSYPEIGRDLAMTPKAAKSLLYRARIELRAKLMEFFIEA